MHRHQRVVRTIASANTNTAQSPMSRKTYPVDVTIASLKSDLDCLGHFTRFRLPGPVAEHISVEVS